MQGIDEMGQKIVSHDAALTGVHNIPFTRAAVLAPFIAYMESQGIPTESYLRKARIPVSMLHAPQAHVPLYLCYRFLETTARSEGIDNLGLKVGETTSLDDIGAFGHVLQQARSIYEYLQIGMELIGSVTSGERIWLTNDGEAIRFNHYIPYINDFGRQQSEWFTLIITINTIHKATQGQWKPVHLHLAAGYQGKLPPRELLSDTTISRGGQHSYFTLPRAVLKLPMPQAINVTPAIDDVHLHIGSPHPMEFHSALETLIETLLIEGYPDVHLAAEAAGTSTRTLQRRLAELGLSYSSLVNTTRMRLATRWLVTTAKPIKEIAVALGYGDASNFTRAFRAQTGISPKEYRYLQSRSSH
jgi:AraC-like DNA-binding protein